MFIKIVSRTVNGHIEYAIRYKFFFFYTSFLFPGDSTWMSKESNIERYCWLRDPRLVLYNYNNYIANLRSQKPKITPVKFTDLEKEILK